MRRSWAICIAFRADEQLLVLPTSYALDKSSIHFRHRAEWGDSISQRNHSRMTPCLRRSSWFWPDRHHKICGLNGSRAHVLSRLHDRRRFGRRITIVSCHGHFLADGVMKQTKPSYRGHRFPAEIVSCCPAS